MFCTENLTLLHIPDTSNSFAQIAPCTGRGTHGCEGSRIRRGGGTIPRISTAYKELSCIITCSLWRIRGYVVYKEKSSVTIPYRSWYTKIKNARTGRFYERKDNPCNVDNKSGQCNCERKLQLHGKGVAFVTDGHQHAIRPERIQSTQMMLKINRRLRKLHIRNCYIQSHGFLSWWH